MGKKILLADDSITIQKVIELTFSDEDFEVVTVGNGRLAVERVLDVRPDIVLCDIIMPEKDGYEVCDFIKRNPQLANVPVLLLTGAFEPFDQERAARVNCDGFLAKPFEPETLIAKVKDLLQKAAARSSSVTGPQRIVQVPPAAAPPPARPVPVSPPPPTPMVTATPVVVAPPPAPPPPPSPTAPPPPVATVGFEPTLREPAPREAAAFSAPPPRPAPPPTEEVRFIPDEPFDDLESAGFEPPPSATPAADPVPEPTLPPEPVEPEVYMPDELEAEPELLQMTPEETQSLASPPPSPEDSSSTVMFRPAPVSWTQQPTLEVPLETRAQAGLESAQAALSEEEDETPVFEEVLEEDVEGLAEPVGVPEPLPIPVAAAAPPAPPAVTPPPAPAPPPAPEPRVPEVIEAAAQELAPSLEPPAAFESPAPVPPPPPAEAARPEPRPAPSERFGDVPAPVAGPAAAVPPGAAEIAVPNDMVAQIAQRVVAQISEKVVRQVAWEVIPDLAEGLIKKEIERLKAELQET